MSRNAVFRLLAVFFVSVSMMGASLVATPAFAAAGDMADGIVESSDGTPIAGATVCIVELDLCRTTPTMVAYGDGYFHIDTPFVGAASLTLSVTAPGYQDKTQPIVFEESAGGVSYSRDNTVVLEPVSQPDPGNGDGGEAPNDGDDGGDLPYDPEQVVQFCGYRTDTGAEANGSYVLGGLISEGLVAVSDDGTVSLVDGNPFSVYLGPCDGRTPTPEGVQLLPWPYPDLAIVTYCDNGVTIDAEAYSLQPGYHYILEGKGTWNPVIPRGWINWNEVSPGITQGPCVDDNDDEDNGDDGGALPYDPDEVIATCAFHLGLEKEWNVPLGVLLGYGHGTVDENGDLTLTSTSLMYLGPCTGAESTERPLQILDDPDTPISVCDNGVTRTGPFYDLDLGDIFFISGKTSYPPAGLFNGYSLNWNEARAGVTQGPCETGDGDSQNGGDNGNGDDQNDGDNGSNTDDGDNGDGTVGVQITVQVLLNGDASVEGSDFGVYAPEASTLPSGAFFTGVVGTNNVMTVSDIIPGVYNVAIAPVDGDLIEFSITVEGDTTSLIVDLRTASSDETAASTDEAGKATDGVTGLPSTGTGSGSVAGALWMASAASVLTAAGALLIRQKRA